MFEPALFPRVLTALLLAATLPQWAGCGGAANHNWSTDGGGSGSDDGSTGPVTFTLALDSTTSVATVGGNSPQMGRWFLDAAVRLANMSESVPLAANAAFFSVTTADAITVMASAQTPRATMACAADLSVSAGGMLACHVIFEVPAGAVPTRLGYLDAMGRKASVPIVLVLQDGLYNRTDSQVVNGCDYMMGMLGPTPRFTLARTGQDMYLVNGFVVGSMNKPESLNITLVDNKATARDLLTAETDHMGCTWDATLDFQFNAVLSNAVNMIIVVNRSNSQGCTWGDSCMYSVGSLYVKQ